MLGDDTFKLPFNNERLSYADDIAPGCNENGFNPPKPKGVYNKLGFGKKNGNEPGILEGTLADEDGIFLVLDSDFLDLEDLGLDCGLCVE